MISIKEQTANTTKQEQKVTLLKIANSFPTLLGFLNQADKIKLSQVDSVIREIVLDPQYWKKLVINQQSTKWNEMLIWLSKYMNILKPQSLFISIFDKEESDFRNLISIFMQGTLESIQTLDLYCESDDVHLACSLCMPNIKHFIARSQCLSDDLLGFMCQNLKQVNSITIIKNDTYFTATRLTKFLENRPMQKIIIKPYLLDFEEITQISQNSAQSLKQLEIDVQECEGQVIVQMIKPLKKLQQLRLYHLENLQTDEEIWKILYMQQNLSQLGLTKTYNFKMQRILSCIRSPHLLILDITDSRFATDEDLINLAKGSPNLKNVNISWCNNINCAGIIGLFQNCLKLEKINLTGVKDAKDEIFGQYFNELSSQFDEDLFWKSKKEVFDALQSGKKIQQVKSYPIQYFFPKENTINWNKINILRKVKEFDCRNCNSVSDKMLKVFYIINRKARVYNYYGYTMSLYASDYESEVY